MFDRPSCGGRWTSIRQQQRQYRLQVIQLLPHSRHSCHPHGCSSPVLHAANNPLDRCADRQRCLQPLHGHDRASVPEALHAHAAKSAAVAVGIFSTSFAPNAQIAAAMRVAAGGTSGYFAGTAAGYGGMLVSTANHDMSFNTFRIGRKS